MTRFQTREAEDCDDSAILEIFNYYVRHGFGAYPEEPVPPSFFGFLRENSRAFPVVEDCGKIVGFAILKPFLPFSTFRKTASVTYFVSPGYTRTGVGTLLLDALTIRAKMEGFAILIANISSKNTASIEFHRKSGFRESGRLSQVGVKFGEPFDLVWMQKDLNER
jgi:L-amino acid N-acyltransferase YncA